MNPCSAEAGTNVEHPSWGCLDFAQAFGITFLRDRDYTQVGPPPNLVPSSIQHMCDGGIKRRG